MKLELKLILGNGRPYELYYWNFKWISFEIARHK